MKNIMKKYYSINPIQFFCCHETKASLMLDGMPDRLK